MNDKTPTLDIDPATATDPELREYHQRIRKDFTYDLTAHDNYIKDFDAYEAMLLSKPYDSVSRKMQSGMSNGRTTTIYLERAGHVAGKLPSGQVKAAGKNDEGLGAIWELIRTQWVYKNANAQKPLLKKFRLWQFNGSIYGFMPMYYDWNVTEHGYVGPDCWLWHPRNFIPQVGRASIDDMDYCHAITYVGEEYLEGLLDDTEGGWDNDEVNRLIAMLHDGEKSVDVTDQRHSLVTRQRQLQAERGRIMLATRYESGKEGNWVVFAPEYNGVVLRTIRNPHKNGLIPFVIKYATDLFDNIYGLGDFQRAKPLQFADDGLDNFYFAGIKRSLYPSMIINPAGVVKSSISHDAGSILQETIQGSIREYRTDPAGMSTYQGAKQVIEGAHTFQAGSTQLDITGSQSGDPSFSKTDAGVNQQVSKEDTRDNQDRIELEMAIETLIDRMMGLIPVLGTETIPINIWSEEVEQLIDGGYGDSLKWLVSKKHMTVSKSGQHASIKIPAELYKDADIRFHMEFGSTAQQDKRQQLQALDGFVKDMTSMQNEIVEMKNQGMTIDWKLIAEIKGELSGVPQLGKIFRQMTPQESQQWQQSQAQANQPPKKAPTEQMRELINYKDAPPDIQRQMESEAGWQPSQVGMSIDQHLKTVKQATDIHNQIQNSPEMTAAHETAAELRKPLLAHVNKATASGLQQIMPIGGDNANQ